VAIEGRFTLHCDWCGIEPDPGQAYKTYEEAYTEMQRVSKVESWLLQYRESRVIFTCPECVAAGRVRGT